MPTLDATEYERFSYDEPSRAPLSLDEAVKKARELRASDASRNNFYRIEYADDSHMSFQVTTVPAASVYADFTARISQALARFWSYTRSK